MIGKLIAGFKKFFAPDYRLLANGFDPSMTKARMRFLDRIAQDKKNKEIKPG